MVKKPKWDKPQLIVLTRGKPEKGVLNLCKKEGTVIFPLRHNRACAQACGVYCYTNGSS